jgi:hypothetical protein
MEREEQDEQHGVGRERWRENIEECKVERERENRG